MMIRQSFANDIHLLKITAEYYDILSKDQLLTRNN